MGSLIVGAADGLGGKLIRTVSFFGWTFPVSFFGGTAPLGTLGIFSAITLTFTQATVGPPGCQMLIPQASFAQRSITLATILLWPVITAPTGSPIFSWSCDVDG